jgi:hypothetical protein
MKEPRHQRNRKAPKAPCTLAAKRLAGGGARWGTRVACYEPADADARPLERGSPETKPRSCGSQPAHESLLNRRLDRLRRPPGASPSLLPLQRMLEILYFDLGLDSEYERPAC